MTREEQAVLLAYTRHLVRWEGASAWDWKRLLRGAVKRAVASAPALYSEPSFDGTDVLFVHTLADEPERIAALVLQLRAAGLEVRHEVLSRLSVVTGRRLTRPGVPVHRDLRWAAAHATYLVRKYRPRVLVTLENHLLLSPFFREEMRGKGTYVNLSHGVTPSNAWHSMTAFDYYFLFGESSLAHLRKNPVRIGSTRVLLTGSPFINAPEAAPTPDPASRVVVYFSSLAANNRSDVFIRGARTVTEWARRRPDFHVRVKLHPLETPETLTSMTRGLANAEVLLKQTSMREALEGASLVIHTSSNAALEAAILGIPSVIVNDTTEPDTYLELERFFLPRAGTVEELDARVEGTLSDYDTYAGAARRFHSFHIARSDSVAFIAEQLIRLSHGEKLEGTIDLPEELSGLAGLIAR